MTKPKLHFSHANSYPAGTYRQLFELLAADFEVGALDMHGHNPNYPVGDGWHRLVDELIDELERRYRGEPVILVGHSLGGMLSLMAAARRPELARCVVMLDSPVVAGWRAAVWRVAKAMGLGERLSPARLSVKRRDCWPSVEDAMRHFASKELFAAWAPGVLQDYLDAGLEPCADGVRLRFTREGETAVYQSLPHHIGKLVARGLPVPAGYLAGIASEENRMAGLEATRALVGRHLRMMPGGHLFPMEAPALTAQAIRAMIAELLASKIVERSASIA
ncbi:alpha/beta fold hydrolase [Massilia sp. YMA4]|uniref:alpha/beta fold hydrolase n=1 Tax=Massilia sp. YMA4 TaxID=1593482 RepID=UPI000DD14749|nr:alpha/beta hydrolase [Massilia sp. YMA4]AXA90984.1 alpha/beta hydrolase [Massilia sp. YMA4]